MNVETYNLEKKQVRWYEMHPHDLDPCKFYGEKMMIAMIIAH